MPHGAAVDIRRRAWLTSLQPDITLLRFALEPEIVVLQFVKVPIMQNLDS